MSTRRCGRCGVRYGAETFVGLRAVRVLGPEEVAPHVVRWPDGVVVDVRACARCDAPIARLAPAGRS